jgi:hypothetical protein
MSFTAKVYRDSKLNHLKKYVTNYLNKVLISFHELYNMIFEYKDDNLYKQLHTQEK